ncbi:MAG: S8 family serine peptidase [Solirubrobacterales bacterium]
MSIRIAGRGGIATTAALILLAGAAGARAAFPEDPPNDPLYDASPLPNYANEQWDLASPAAGFDRGISVDRAWALTTGKGATVADIDVGVDFDQPDLSGRWYENPGENGSRSDNGIDDDGNGFVDDWRGWDFYDGDNDATSDTANGHGTNVAGVLGATADNGISVAGIAPDAGILALRTADNILHRGSRLAQAMVYAVDQGADALSMSLGADSFPKALRRAAEYAYRKGAVVAVASGNEFHFHHHYPQSHDHVLAVGGINPDTADLRAMNPNLAPIATDFTVHASYADYGPHLDVVAPTQVPTVNFGGGDQLTWSGTSAATPHVAAVATLIASRAKQVGLDLRPGEAIEIIRMSADDLDDPANGYAPGWDLLSGWGRVNAYEAVRMVRRSRLPPVPDIHSPGWYRPYAGAAADAIRVEATVAGRSATQWTIEIGEGEQPDSWQEVSSGSAGPNGDGVGTTLNGLAAGGYTLRMSATDADGNVGEERVFFEILPPAQRVHRGYPKRLGTSGEASPQLARLDRRPGKEIVLATSDGRLHAYSGRSGDELRGWPQRMKRARGSGPASDRIGTIRSGFLATPAIGDIAGNPRPEVVAAGLDGRLYAYSRRGRLLDGFPFRIKLHGTASDGRLDSSIYASPALADLRGGPKLEAVFGAADQRIYAVNGRGRNVRGWPVRARDEASGGDVTKILSSPAIGDLDGDGSPEVVEGTAEAYGLTPSTSGRVYAFDARGKLLPGWPVAPPALAADSIPLAGEGVPVSPSLADTDGDGDDEVAVAAFTGQPELYDGDGTRLGGAGGQSRFQIAGRGVSSPADAPGALALGANGAFGRTQPGGPLRFFGGIVDNRLAQAQLQPATPIAFEHLLGGWDAGSGAWLDAFPIPTEGWEILTSPALADVDGDGGAEVLNGTSGNVLHAFKPDGSEPPGWPKQTGGWLLASPAVGDVDGDHRNEVVAVTRDGYLLVWDTPAKASASQWPSFRHDARNTGRYGPPLEP